MKKLIPLCLIILLAACNGARSKSVVDPLTIDDASELINDDPLYEKILNEVEAKRIAMQGRITLQAKFKNLSIGDYYDYRVSAREGSISFLADEESNKQYEAAAKPLLDKYKTRIDEQITAYKTVNPEDNPEGFFNVEFVSMRSAYGDGDKVNYIFKITPLKGALEYGAFNCTIRFKKREAFLTSNLNCEFFLQQPADSAFFVKVQSIHYPKNEYDDFTPEEINDTFALEFFIINATVNGHAYEIAKDFSQIPEAYKDILFEKYKNTYDYVTAIKKLYGNEIPSWYDYYMKAMKKIKKEKYPLAYEYETLKL